MTEAKVWHRALEYHKQKVLRFKRLDPAFIQQLSDMVGFYSNFFSEQEIHDVFFYSLNRSESYRDFFSLTKNLFDEESRKRIERKEREEAALSEQRQKEATRKFEDLANKKQQRRLAQDERIRRPVVVSDLGRRFLHLHGEHKQSDKRESMPIVREDEKEVFSSRFEQLQLLKKQTNPLPQKTILEDESVNVELRERFSRLLKEKELQGTTRNSEAKVPDEPSELGERFKLLEQVKGQRKYRVKRTNSSVKRKTNFIGELESRWKNGET